MINLILLQILFITRSIYRVRRYINFTHYNVQLHPWERFIGNLSLDLFTIMISWYLHNTLGILLGYRIACCLIILLTPYIVNFIFFIKLNGNTKN